MLTFSPDPSVAVLSWTAPRGEFISLFGNSDCSFFPFPFFPFPFFPFPFFPFELTHDIGAYPETDDYIAQASQGVAEELTGFDFAATLRERDALLVKLIELKRHAKQIP